jgi:uncharacterized membrane protein
MTSTTDPSEGLTPAPVRRVPVLRPFEWLARGGRDVLQVPGPSLLHGLAVALGGWVIVIAAWRYWYLMPGAFSGFLLVGPILATGLYELSRRLTLGEGRPGFGAVYAAWLRGTRPLVWLGLLLVLAGTLWVMLSSVLFALFAGSPVVTLQGFLREVVLSRTGLFDVWLLLGGVGAAIVFAATAVSAPMLLDRDVDMLSALITSIRACGENPAAMALWAAIIMSLTVLSVATLMLGFVVVVPMIGHATWHAYRDLVDADSLPPRI